MKEIEKNYLHFVILHYRKNKLDTLKALEAFKEKYCLSEKRRKSRTLVWYLSGVAVLVACLTFYALLKPEADERWLKISSSATPMHYLLPDSSTVLLAPHSSFCFDTHSYGKRNRELVMEGKATFAVKHNAACVFRVNGTLSTSTVWGTCFTVDESRTDTAVIQVAEGKVYVATKMKGKAVLVEKDMTACIVRGKPEIRIQSIKEEWGTFIFDNTPLPEVITELSAYYGVRLTIHPVTHQRLTATFKEKRLDEIIDFINRVLGVHIERADS